MGIDDMMDKAKDMLGNVSDEQIEDVAEQVKEKTPDQMDGMVDKAAEFLEGMNDK